MRRPRVRRAGDSARQVPPAGRRTVDAAATGAARGEWCASVARVTRLESTGSAVRHGRRVTPALGGRTWSARRSRGGPHQHVAGDLPKASGDATSVSPTRVSGRGGRARARVGQPSRRRDPRSGPGGGGRRLEPGEAASSREAVSVPAHSAWTAGAGRRCRSSWRRGRRAASRPRRGRTSSHGGRVRVRPACTCAVGRARPRRVPTCPVTSRAPRGHRAETEHEARVEHVLTGRARGAGRGDVGTPTVRREQGDEGHHGVAARRRSELAPARRCETAGSRE